MDTILGQLNLTHEQLVRADSLKTENIRGFGLKNGIVRVVTKTELTDTEKTTLIADLNALSTDPLPKTRLQELKEKPTLTLPEVTEVLKIHGLV